MKKWSVPHYFVYLIAAILFMLAICFLAPTTINASPAMEIITTYTQPDGSTFQAGQRGDEFFNYNVTASGYVIARDPSDNTWKYVVSDQDILSFSARAEQSVPSGAFTSSFLVEDTAKSSFYALEGRTYSPQENTDQQVVKLSDIASSKSAVSSSLKLFKAASTTETKTLPLITIVVGFAGDSSTLSGWTQADQTYSSTYDWANYIYTGETSLTNYYRQASNNKFTWAPATEKETSASGTDGNTNTADKAGDGIIHVTIPGNHNNESGNSSLMEHEDTQIILPALEAAKKYIDFKFYDKDGDGTISTNEAGICFIVAGNEAAAGGPAPSLWAHAMSEAYVSFKDASNNNITVNNYIAFSENMTRYKAGLTRWTEKEHAWLGTLTHELGHYLGLPDLYNTTYTNGTWSDYSVNYASIMASGSWGSYIGTDGYEISSPVEMDAWCKAELGYITPTTINSSGTYTVQSNNDVNGYNCYRINTSNANEYFLIENRQYAGFDQSLKSEYKGYWSAGTSTILLNQTGGIVIWHIDEDVVTKYGLAGTVANNEINVPLHRPGVMPVYFENYTYGGVSFTDPYLNGLFNNSQTYQNLTNYYPLTLRIYNGSEIVSDRISSGITFSTSAAGSSSMDFTVYIPSESSLSMTPSTTLLPAEGGAVTFNITGTNMTKPIGLQVYDTSGNKITDGWASTVSSSGSTSSRSLTLNFPADVSTEIDSYRVRVSYNGAETSLEPSKVDVDAMYAYHTLLSSINGNSYTASALFLKAVTPALTLSALDNATLSGMKATAAYPGTLLTSARVSLTTSPARSDALQSKVNMVLSVNSSYEGKGVYLIHGRKDGGYDTIYTTVSGGTVTMQVSDPNNFAVYAYEKPQPPAPTPTPDPTPAPTSTPTQVIVRVTMYRLYNPNSGEHFFTKNASEKDYLASIGWNYEGVAWTAPETSNTPVYRLYNANGGEHHYTTSASERDMLIGVGWSYEGIGWYSDDSQQVPLYRVYNPNAYSNNHHYTTDINEKNFLVSLGWRYEGIGWYGLN